MSGPPLQSVAAGIQRLRRLALLALLAIAGLAVSSQFVVQLQLERQQAAAEIVNLAGRQRMLSQQIAKDVAGLAADPRDRQVREELVRSLDRFRAAHEQLLGGMGPGLGDPAVKALLEQTRQPWVGLRTAAGSALEGGPAAAAEVRQFERSFVRAMEEAVTAYAQETEAQLRRLRAVELLLAAALVAVTVLLGVAVFRPTFARLQDALQLEQRQEAEILRREAEIRSLFDSIPDRLYRVEGDGHLTEVGTASLEARPLRERLRTLLPPHQAQVRKSGEAALFDLVHDGRCLQVRLLPAGEGKQLALVEDISERLRLEEALSRARTDERGRLGRELHDGLGQQLAGLSMLLRAWERRLEAAAGPSAEEVSRAAGLLDDARQQTRALAHGLLASESVDGGLGPALRRMAEDMGRIFAVPIHVRAAGTVVDLSGVEAAHLLRIASEATMNAVRHSGCTGVWVELSGDAEAQELCVRDDGAGFDGAGNTTGMGLRIMQHRAQVVGGCLQVRPRDEGGTVVCFHRPCTDSHLGETFP